MHFARKIVWFLVLIEVGWTVAAILKRRSQPPEPSFGKEQLPEEFGKWFFNFGWNNNEDENNPWELSGLFEGDILLDSPAATRNGILNEALRWPNATIPYYIEDDDFSDEEQFIILRALREFHLKSCVRFRPYEDDDPSWITFRSGSPGCWTGVGMKPDGQIVNLHSPSCVKHGVIIHEVLHSLGFFHQQSASDRDSYVKIIWKNIKPGHERNFNKYSEQVVSSFGVEYDFDSVMHYGSKAFSKNRWPTIIPLRLNVTIGQRKRLSERDVQKLQLMYEQQCEERGDLEEEEHPDFIDHYNELLSFVSFKTEMPPTL
ncbi:seminal metalloprotease 1-like [Uranotaenia lowii]|uniref:seminal metalloprotease 1-like n=1 Tax=Uranotaenia lowii TaxID=190385 RepID=UPI002478F032|nr:seminal metalloprotease 1-like [Uranotaenia lowii]